MVFRKCCAFGTLGGLLLLLSSCAAIIGIPSKDKLATEQSKIEGNLSSWIGSSVENLVKSYPNVSETLDLGGGKVRYSFRQPTIDYVMFVGYRYYELYFFVSEDGRFTIRVTK